MVSGSINDLGIWKWIKSNGLDIPFLQPQFYRIKSKYTIKQGVYRFCCEWLSHMDSGSNLIVKVLSFYDHNDHIFERQNLVCMDVCLLMSLTIITRVNKDK